MKDRKSFIITVIVRGSVGPSGYKDANNMVNIFKDSDHAALKLIQRSFEISFNDLQCTVNLL